jgi:hypothetical protein
MLPPGQPFFKFKVTPGSFATFAMPLLWMEDKGHLGVVVFPSKYETFSPKAFLTNPSKGTLSPTTLRHY